jgi:hypothetical protein
MERSVSTRTLDEGAQSMAARKARAGSKGKRGRKPPPPGETKRDRFVRIARVRMVNALEAIRLLSNMARGDYEWSMDDIHKMEVALQQQIELVKKEYETAKAPVSRDLVPFDI